MSFNESTVEKAALSWFGELGYTIGHGPHLTPKNALRKVSQVAKPFICSIN